MIPSLFIEAMNLLPGQEVFFPTGSKPAARRLRDQLLDYKQKTLHIDPINIFPLDFTVSIKKGFVFVRAYKSGDSPKTAFVKGEDGKLTKISLKSVEASERERMTTLMRRDGFNEEEIEKALKGDNFNE
jgi:hypothetical protein